MFGLILAPTALVLLVALTSVGLRRLPLVLGGRFGVLPLLGVIVARVALDQREMSPFVVVGGLEETAVNLGLEANAPKVLLSILFANGVLVVSDRLTLQHLLVITLGCGILLLAS